MEAVRGMVRIFSGIAQYPYPPPLGKVTGNSEGEGGSNRGLSSAYTVRPWGGGYPLIILEVILGVAEK